MSAGEAIFWPAFSRHTIRNPGSSPITYLMLKWRGARESAARASDCSSFRFAERAPSVAGGVGIASREIWDQPTGYLRVLHGHVTALAPGQGYPAHVDGYDVAILTLTGTVECLGQTVEPGSLLYFAAGEAHDMRNTGSAAATYLVVELHARVGGFFSRPGLRERLWAWRRAAIRAARETPYLGAGGKKVGRAFPRLKRLFLE
jgi:hypothetical protein